MTATPKPRYDQRLTTVACTRIDDSLAKRIYAFMDANRVEWSEALRQLLERGLNSPAK